MPTYYRIHSAGEPIETVLDPSRPDGWVASDESTETQPRGVSACASIGDLIRYCRTYGLTPQLGDVVLRLEGRICDEDRDQWAVRVEVESVSVMGPADRLERLARARDYLGRELSADRVDMLLDRWGSLLEASA